MTRLDEISEKFDELRIEGLPELGKLDIEETGYHPGSRNAELDNVARWLEDDSRFALWISGPAGVGKSILARHLADLLRAGDRLACMVHIGANLDYHPSSLIQRMARELTVLHPRCRVAIAEAVKQQISNMDHTASVFERYLYNPIVSLGAPAPLLFIIDALDEWPPDYCRMFPKALEKFSKHADRIRFIFTSRMQDQISDALRCLSPLHLVIRRVSDNIMKSYFEDAFSRIDLDDDIRSDDKVIDSLVKQAQGLFIWAATVCRSMEYSEGLPASIVLKQIISSPSRATNPRSALWDLYDKGIRRLCPKPHDRGMLLQVLRVMAAMRRSLSSSSFTKFAGVDESEVQLFHRRLRSFYDGQQEWKPDTISPLRLTTHLSFRNFLFANDINSAPAHDFVIKPQSAHSMLSRVCQIHVKRYLETPDAPFETSEDPHFEEYVLTYWMAHAFVTNREIDLDDNLSKHLQILRRLTCSTNLSLSFVPSFPSFEETLSFAMSDEKRVLIMSTYLGKIDGQLLPSGQVVHPSRMVLCIVILFHSFTTLESCGGLFKSQRLTNVLKDTKRAYLLINPPAMKKLRDITYLFFAAIICVQHLMGRNANSANAPTSALMESVAASLLLSILQFANYIFGILLRISNHP